MQLSTVVTGRHTVVSPSGDLDVATAGELRGYLDRQLAGGVTALVVDLTAVGFLDSTTLGVLIGIRNRLIESGGGIELVCPHERLLRIFQITGLDGVFTIHPSLADID